MIKWVVGLAGGKQMVEAVIVVMGFKKVIEVKRGDAEM